MHGGEPALACKEIRLLSMQLVAANILLSDEEEPMSTIQINFGTQIINFIGPYFC
jgi:hypothetical protein